MKALTDETPAELSPEPVDDPNFRERLARALGENYRIEKLIGEGGFGRVYSAKDIRLDRAVAIKAIRPDLAGASAFTDRFRKEAMALAKFRHPGIIPIYDIQEHEGLIYFVMPLIVGDSLRTRLQRHRLIAPQETRKLLVDLCQCLSATHRAGIVHRDIKPDNVMLEADSIARALLMDFGVAKNNADFTETNSGMMVGTPTYMSPEQANGDSVVDHRSDIYSVGVLAYHMLTGRPPFVGGSIQQVTMGHIGRTADHIRKLNPSVPAAMADAIMRCLEKDPDERFQSAADLSAALQQVVFSAENAPAQMAPNFAMPFFAGGAVVCLLAAFAGGERLRFVTMGEWIWLAGGFALLALVCSPILRATTEPMSRRTTSWIRKRLGK